MLEVDFPVVLGDCGGVNYIDDSVIVQVSILIPTFEVARAVKQKCHGQRSSGFSF